MRNQIKDGELFLDLKSRDLVEEKYKAWREKQIPIRKPIGCPCRVMLIGAFVYRHAGYSYFYEDTKELFLSGALDHLVFIEPKKNRLIQFFKRIFS